MVKYQLNLITNNYVAYYDRTSGNLKRLFDILVSCFNTIQFMLSIIPLRNIKHLFYNRYLF